MRVFPKTSFKPYVLVIFDMKKIIGYFIIITFLISSFSFLVLSGVRNNGNTFLNTLSEPSIANNLPNIKSGVNAFDSRGHLTGRYFFLGFNDTDSDFLYNTLLLDVEVNITETTIYEYLVRAELFDPNFLRRVSDGEFGFHYEEGNSIQGVSNPEQLSIGVQNVTVAFNCSYLRAFQMGGPYEIVSTSLADWGSPSWMVDDRWEYDEYPLFRISGQYDIFTFDPLIDTSELTVNTAGLVGDDLEIDFTFNSFDHDGGNVEDYYCHLMLTNSTDFPIATFEEFFNLSSSTTNDLTLKIPSEYLSGFYQYGGFENNTPVIKFKEFTMAQLTGYNEWLYDHNVSYMSETYPTYSINVTHASPTTSITNIYDFGSLNEGDMVSFILYPETLDSILKLQINRTEPINQWTPQFHITIIDGYGRWIDLWNMGQFQSYITWNDWNMNTETQNILAPLGKNLSPWFVTIEYPDQPDEVFPASLLRVSLDYIVDSSPPLITYNNPLPGDTYQQYYGIPFRGSIVDETFVTQFSIYNGANLLFTYSPFENTGGSGIGALSEFSFVWYPPDNLTGPINLKVEAFDVIFNLATSILPITIQPGTPPVPDSTIAKGLNWLRNKQVLGNPSNWDYGAWEYYDGQPSAGMTALATLSFIQAGLAHDTVVTDGINFLRDAFEDDNDPNVPGKVIRQSGHASYESAMATIALIAYNATLPSYDGPLNDLIDEAVEWLVATQNDETWGVNPSEPWYGGWRYGDDHMSSDLSVSQWVILALASYGYNDPVFWDKVVLFVERCRGGYWDDVTPQFIADGGFTYTPSTQDWRDQGGGSYGSMTAAGIWGLFLSGVNPSNANITTALDWIGSHSIDEIAGQNPNSGKSFEYYWYLSASKAFLMAGREQDQWWYDAITQYLNTHMVIDTPTSAYWSGNSWDEPPIFATVQAILSQQVLYGDIPTDSLEISLESENGAVLCVWNGTLEAGYNYTTGTEESGGATYSGMLADTQTVLIASPSKGEYMVDILPTTDEAGDIGSQQLILRGRALSKTGHILEYSTEVIDYNYPSSYPQILRYRLVISTFSGLDIHFIPVNPPLFSHAVEATSVDLPSYVDIGDVVTVSFSLQNLGLGMIDSGTIFTVTDLSVTYPTLTFVSWAQGATQDLSFEYGTSGVSAGLQVIVIGVIGLDMNPLIIRLKIQVGNRAPEGTLNPVSNVINGVYELSWTATDADGDSLTFQVILVNPDASEDVLASSLTSTSYSFDSTAYLDGPNYKFVIKVTDGIDTIELTSNLFEIQNGLNTTDDVPALTPGFDWLFSLTVMGLLLLWFRKRK